MSSDEPTTACGIPGPLGWHRDGTQPTARDPVFRELDLPERFLLQVRAPDGTLEQRGIPVSAFPQSGSRTVPASQRLHAAIVEGRLVHGDDPRLTRHVPRRSRVTAAAAGGSTRRGRADKIDGVVALAMALDRIENQPAPAQLLGWM